MKGKLGNGEHEILKKYGGEGKDRDWVTARGRRVEEGFFPKKGEKGFTGLEAERKENKTNQNTPRSGQREVNDAVERDGVVEKDLGEDGGEGRV